MVYIAFAYGILTLIGGVIGYLTKGSTASLISGSVSGLLILLSAFALLKGKMFGYYGLLGLSGILTIVFVMRLLKTHAFMPSGLMLTLSAVMFVLLLVKKSSVLPTL